MFEWTFSTEKERSPRWYLVAGIVAVTLVVWGFFVKLYAMSVVVILFVGVYVLYENNSQNLVRVVFGEDAFEVDGTRYEYAKMKEFGIVSITEDFTLLRVLGRGIAGSLVDVPVPQGLPLPEFRAFLLERMEENPDMKFGNIERLLHVFRV